MGRFFKTVYSIGYILDITSVKQHIVYLEKDSLLGKIANKTKISVNSFHVQCIKRLGKNLKVTAKRQNKNRYLK